MTVYRKAVSGPRFALVRDSDFPAKWTAVGEGKRVCGE